MELLRGPALADIHAARTDIARRSEAVEKAEFSLGGEEKAADTAPASKSPESFRKFEAMVLQTFIQNMLPKDGAAVYGKGMAGDMWKSLMAEKMAQVMAERGGIGIADRMLGQYDAAKTKPSTEASVSAQTTKTAGEAAGDGRLSIAPAILDSMQRSLSDLLTGDLKSSPEASISSTTQRG
jgi:flagellar protein FlgJ